MLIFAYSVLALKLRFWRDDFSSISPLLVVSYHHIQLEFDVEKKNLSLVSGRIFPGGMCRYRLPFPGVVPDPLPWLLRSVGGGGVEPSYCWTALSATVGEGCARWWAINPQPANENGHHTGEPVCSSERCLVSIQCLSSDYFFFKVRRSLSRLKVCIFGVQQGLLKRIHCHEWKIGFDLCCV